MTEEPNVYLTDDEKADIYAFVTVALNKKETWNPQAIDCLISIQRKMLK